MTPEVYIAFVVAAALLIVAPGPSVMLVISHAMGAGLRAFQLGCKDIQATTDRLDGRSRSNPAIRKF